MDEQYTHIPPYPQSDLYGPPQVLIPEAFPSPTDQSQSILLGPEFDSNSQAANPSRNQARSRRPKTSGAEHVKHRRTRSGCYTCRQRRVKCDEARPVCDRCRKGKRDCSYPEVRPSTSKSTRTKTSAIDSASSSSSDDGEGGDDDDDTLCAIPEDEGLDSRCESNRYSSSSSKRRYSAISTGNNTPVTPVDARSAKPSLSRTSTSKQFARWGIKNHAKWAALPKEVKFYLKYHQDYIYCHHYAFKHDGGDFLKTTFLEIAMNFEPLLYAVVAFAAYHFALTQPDGKARQFLDYYDRSVSLFRQSLARSEKNSVATLLTMLQLATIEEFLGDWVNLLMHQQAAQQMITDLYTPQSILQSDTHRRIINWYLRFDLFAGLMSGGATVLGREWFDACTEFCVRQARDRPNDLVARFDEYFSTLRLLGTEVALFFASKATGSMSDEHFQTGLESLQNKMDAIKDRLETAFTDPACFITGCDQMSSEDDLADSVDSHFAYSGQYFTMNFVLLDFSALSLLWQHQIHLIRSQQDPERAAAARDPPKELRDLALKMCKTIEAIERSNQGPPGVLLGCLASLGLACVHLPKDKKHLEWFRRKFALIEQLGYIYPPGLRKRMSDVWGEDMTYWWLPNDEGFHPIIRSMRDFIDFRTDSAERQLDAKAADTRDLNGLFNNMRLQGQQDLLEQLGFSMDDAIFGIGGDADDGVSESILDHESGLDLVRNV